MRNAIFAAFISTLVMVNSAVIAVALVVGYDIFTEWADDSERTLYDEDEEDIQ